MYLVHSMSKGLRERITGVASAQVTIMGKTKCFGPHWWWICLVSVPCIFGPVSLDPDISSFKRLWTLPSVIGDTRRPNLVMLRTVIAAFEKTITGRRN